MNNLQRTLETYDETVFGVLGIDASNEIEELILYNEYDEYEFHPIMTDSGVILSVINEILKDS